MLTSFFIIFIWREAISEEIQWIYEQASNLHRNIMVARSRPRGNPCGFSSRRSEVTPENIQPTTRKSSGFSSRRSEVTLKV